MFMYLDTAIDKLGKIIIRMFMFMHLSTAIDKLGKNY